MKKIWSVRKEKEGVSPVIATILMVAITVVLAAVLYVMVMRDWGIDPDLRSGTIDFIDIRSNSSVEVEFGAFGSTTKPTQVKFILEDRTGTRITFTWPTAPDSDSYTMKSSDENITATYRDLLPTSNEINSGDTVIIDGLSPSENYEILIVNLNGDKYMLGGTTSFNLPE